MLKNKILKVIQIEKLYYRCHNLILVFMLIALSHPAYASIMTNISSKKLEVGGSMQSNKILIEVLDNVEPQLLVEDKKKFEEAVSANLPMKMIDGIAIKAQSPINITQYNSAPLIVLFGINDESLSVTPLSQNALIKWKNITSNQYNETPLFDAIKGKIPTTSIPKPIAPVTASHHYITEIIDLRSKLNLQWEVSEYTIQIVNGDWVSNIIKIKLTMAAQQSIQGNL